MATARATGETVLSLIIAELAERELVNENARAAALLELLEEVKSQVLFYREMVKRKKAVVKAQRDCLKSTEAYLKALKQLNKPVAEEAMKKQLDEEIKRSSDLNAELEEVKQRIDALLRYAKALEEEAKRPHDLPNLEKRYAELQEEVKSKEEGERAIDEKIQKTRCSDESWSQWEDAALTLLGEDDNSEGGGFLSTGGAND